MTDNVVPRPDAPRSWLPARPYVQALSCVVGFGVVWLTLALIADSLASRWLPAWWLSRVLPVLVAACAVVAYVVSVRIFESRWPIELRIRRLPELLGGLVLGTLACLSVVAVLLANQWVSLSVRGTIAELVAGVLVSGVAVGVGEELLFRGVLYRHIEHLAGTTIALASTSVLFGLVHLANPGVTAWGVTCVAIEGGLFFGLVFTMTRSLWLVMGLHIAWNAVQGPVLGSTISGGLPGAGWLHWTPLGPDIWTGGAFGMEASALTLGLFLGVSAILVVLMRVVPRFTTRWVGASRLMSGPPRP